MPVFESVIGATCCVQCCIILRLIVRFSSAMVTQCIAVQYSSDDYFRFTSLAGRTATNSLRREKNTVLSLFLNGSVINNTEIPCYIQYKIRDKFNSEPKA